METIIFIGIFSLAITVFRQGIGGVVVFFKDEPAYIKALNLIESALVVFTFIMLLKEYFN